jgi:hypothetical protein
MSRKNLARKGKNNYWVGLLQTDKEFILSRVAVDLETRCWEWLGSVSSDGYGKCKRKGVTYRAHRLSYLVFKGDITEGLFVCHHCDNPLCVNPEHLWLGTHEENELDKTAKGRRSPSPTVSHPHSLPRGSKHHKSKLNEEMAHAIYKLAIEGYSISRIKEELDLTVDKTTIGRVIQHGKWGTLNLKTLYGEVTNTRRKKATGYPFNSLET